MFRRVRNGETKRVSMFFFGDCHTSVSGQYFASVTSGLFRIATYILLEGRGQPVTRRRVGQLLWSESGSDQAGAVVRQTVARIRRFQSEHQFRLVAADANMLWIVKEDDVYCDLIDFLDLLENPTAAGAVRLCEVYSGDLLGSLGSAGDAFEEWLAVQRSHLHGQFIDVVSRAIAPGSEISREQRDFCARRLLRLEPCHEGAYRALMRGAAETGQTSTVRQLFEECTRRLSEELGIQPEEETVQLFKHLLRLTASAGF